MAKRVGPVRTARHQKQKRIVGPVRTARQKQKRRVGPVQEVPKKRRVGPVVSVKTAPRKDSLASQVQRMCRDLESSLNARARSLGFFESFTIHPPEVPPGLTLAHLDAIQSALCGTEHDFSTGAERLKPGLELCILPRLEDLQGLAPDSAYVSMMYPKNQRPEDTADGLTSYRSFWWDHEANIESITFRTITDTDPKTGALRTHHETVGEAYLRSMQKELTELAPESAVVLFDTAVKPNIMSVWQHYGTTEGIDPSKDPLLPLFQDAFRTDVNRCNHTHDELMATLLPLCQRKVDDALTRRGLTLPDSWEATVMLSPASLANLWMTLTTNGRASSRVNVWEWSSTPLLDADGNATGRRLGIDRHDCGGAAGVSDMARCIRHDSFGARLAVVLRKKRN